MYKNKKIIAIIPARGGSKRLPRKNVLSLAGKPLISYSIEHSLASKLVDRTIVSSDDNEIIEISKRYGAEVIKRPKEYAGDISPPTEAYKHVIDTLKSKEGFKRVDDYVDTYFLLIF